MCLLHILLRMYVCMPLLCNIVLGALSFFLAVPMVLVIYKEAFPDGAYIDRRYFRHAVYLDSVG